ncbi:hypothetical protein [uncultured Croceitalea sp.]|uniref:hypothetical protein n=1 Tax=uncultured Croceitalea sp. TaxID=1798908 RepID=UPI0033063773
MKNRFRYGLTFIAAIVLIVHFLDMDYQNFSWKNLLGPASMAFLIAAMIIEIRNSNKDEK